MAVHPVTKEALGNLNRDVDKVVGKLELDHLASIAQRAAKLGQIRETAGGGFGVFPTEAVERDPDQTVVHFDIPTKTGGFLFGTATVHHDGSEHPTDVILPPHFRDWAVPFGVERDDVCFEHYLVAMAKHVFARQEKHLTCAKCGTKRGEKPARCGENERHNWTVAK